MFVPQSDLPTSFQAERWQIRRLSVRSVYNPTWVGQSFKPSQVPSYSKHLVPSIFRKCVVAGEQKRIENHFFHGSQLQPLRWTSQSGGALRSARLRKEAGRCMWNAPARRAGRQFLNERVKQRSWHRELRGRPRDSICRGRVRGEWPRGRTSDTSNPIAIG